MPVHLEQGSVVLDDVAVRTVEQVLISVEFVLEQTPAKRSLHLPLSRRSLLPAWKSNLTYDLIDVGDNALDNHWGFRVLHCFEQLRERRLAAVFLNLDRYLALRFNNVLGEFKELLEKVDRSEHALLVLHPQVLETFGKSDKGRVLSVPAKSRRYPDLDIDGVSVRVRQKLLDHAFIKDQGVEIVSDRLNRYIPVNQLDCLGTKGMPKQLPVA